MSLSFGKKLLAIPGPTNVPDEVLQAMQRPALDIYAGEMIEVTQRVRAQVRRVFRTASEHVYLYIANGHGAWEGCLVNTLSRGDKVLVLESGRFAPAWGEMAALMGVSVETIHAEPGTGVDPAAVEARLRADDGHEIKAVLVVQIDTASGVWNDIEAIGQAIRAAGHPALFMVDGVASIGCVPFEMDAWGVDVAMTGSQKGLMTPPGLGFVAANARARALAATADLRSYYWDWENREGPIFYQQFCGTPPEHLMFALDKALEILLDQEGLENAWARHTLLAEATRRAVARWAEGGAIGFNITDEGRRSDTITMVVCREGFDAEALRNFTRDIAGVTLGAGIGAWEGQGFRIAHMGHVNAVAQLGVLGAIEMGMKALGWPHGAGGTQAAIDFLGERMAQ